MSASETTIRDDQIETRTRANRTVGRMIAGLLVVGAVLFIAGTSSERHTETVASAAHAESAGPVEGSAEAEAGEKAGNATSGVTAKAPVSESTESKVLGINRESSAIVAAAAVTSVVLAGLALRLSRRSVFAVIVAFAVVFAVFDFAEFAHQRHVSRNGLAGVALILAVVHLAVVVLAGREVMWARSTAAAS